ncbi:MAG: hypothetical protein PHH13_02560 [Candidatus Peribacteraceae bacterium]|nr:hypothetical protein [Candidatus Peribacteraceae bacterium]
MHVLTSHLRWFAHQHDELPSFHAGYLVLTLVVASLLNLGVFVVLIAAHMTLDFVKYRERYGYGLHLTVEGMVRESLVDFLLFFIALVFSVYLHPSVALVGVSSILRSEITVLEALGTVIPKTEILHRFFHVVARIRHYLGHAHPHLRQHWSSVDRMCFVGITFGVLLIIFAPVILHVGWSHVANILAEELIPWRV